MLASHIATRIDRSSEIRLRRGELLISSTHLEPLIRLCRPGKLLLLLAASAAGAPLLLHCRSSIGRCCPGWCSIASCRLV